MTTRATFDKEMGLELCEMCEKKNAIFRTSVHRPGLPAYVVYCCAQPSCRVKTGTRLAFDTKVPASHWKVETNVFGFVAGREKN